MPLLLTFPYFIKSIILGLFILGLSSCSSIEPSRSANGFYQLQAIPLALQHKIFLESLTFKQAENRQLLTQIEINEIELKLAAMTYSGLAVMQAKWHQDKGLLNFSSQIFDKDMFLRIIRDIQLVKWPKSAVKVGLSNGYQLVSSKQGVERSRKIMAKDKVILGVIYTPKKVVLTNFIENYELVIENVNE